MPRKPGETGDRENEYRAGGKKMEEMSMTATETARLIDWLMANGHTEKEAIECVKYIATGIQQTSKEQ
jgi:hypothetical protein